MKYKLIFDLPNEQAEAMRKQLSEIMESDIFQHVFADDGHSFMVFDEGVFFVCIHSFPGMLGVECFAASELPATCTSLPVYIAYDDNVYKMALTEGYSVEEQVDNEYLKAWATIRGNYDAVRSHHQKCGCIGCCSIFDSERITDETPYDKAPDGTKSVICPFCGSIAVLHEDSGLPITEEFLMAMQRFA